MATTTSITDSSGVAVPATEEEQRRLQREKNQALSDLLQSWLDETNPEVIQEQRETWEYLKQALDEDRPSYRKLFP